MTQTPQELYPAQYYATFDTPAQFWDARDVSDLSVIPEASTMLALTEAQWLEKGGSSGQQKLKVVKDGELVDYIPTVTTQDLKSMAQAELLGWVMQQASLVNAMGQVFSATMKEYVASLQGIVSGASGIQQSIPKRPSASEVADS